MHNYIRSNRPVYVVKDEAVAVDSVDDILLRTAVAKAVAELQAYANKNGVVYEVAMADDINRAYTVLQVEGALRLAKKAVDKKKAEADAE